MSIQSFFMAGSLLGLTISTASAQQKTYLYPSSKDTSQGYYLTYAAANPNHKAIIVCPGGGYTHVAMDHEGKMVGEWLSGLGYDVYVIHYRVSIKDQKFYYPTQLNDVKEVARMVGKKYKTFGVMGFSAGGHLAGSYLTDKKNQASFGILMYPVISTDSSFWHRGSFNSLLGPDYRNLATGKFSVDKNISKKTPPLFFVHCTDDKAVPAKNSEVAFAASTKFQPLSELHLYEQGGHGFGMRPVNKELSKWQEALKDWLKNF